MVNEPELVKRMCLKCSKEFKSKGAGNRICEKCNTDNKYLSSRQNKFGSGLYPNGCENWQE